MPDCIAVDPSDLSARADRLRALGADLRPTVRQAEGLRAELTAMGSTSYGHLGDQFGSSWSLTFHTVAGTLEAIADRLDQSAVIYAAFEDMLAEAFN